MTKNTWAIAAAVALGLAGLSRAGAAPKTGPNAPIPVGTFIATSVDGGAPRVQGDGNTYFTTTVKNQQTVYSAIDRFLTGTGWSLTTYSFDRNFTPSGRTVFFDLSEPADENSPIPPPAGHAPAHLIAKCNVVNVDMLKLAQGTFADCPGSFRFKSSNGAWYRLAFNPDNYPQVNRLRVTCLTSDGADCKTWTITPSGGATAADPLPKNRTKLLEINTNEEVLADLGDYYVSFTITVAR